MNKCILIVFIMAIANPFAPCFSQDTFLPLQVGNIWYYRSIPEIYSVSVVDTVTIQDHHYYELDWWGQKFIRLDSLNRMIEYIEDDEQILLDFRMEEGDTIFNYEYGYTTCISKDSVETFTGVRDIQIVFHTNRDTTFSENEWIATFQKNIGIVEDHWPSLSRGVLIGMILDGIKYGETSVSNSLSSEASGHLVFENSSPNPFNSSTTIKYKLSSQSFVTIQVYNTMGAEIAMLENAVKPAGTYSISWCPVQMCTGVYYIKISVDDNAEVHKTLYLK